eukprot:350542-Chlamydomonas_euryale.AAC.4
MPPPTLPPGGHLNLQDTCQHGAHQDAVEPGRHKRHARLVDRLCKALPWHQDAAHIERILAKEAGQRPGAVLNLKLGAVGLQRGVHAPLEPKAAHF